MANQNSNQADGVLAFLSPEGLEKGGTRLWQTIRH